MQSHQFIAAAFPVNALPSPEMDSSLDEDVLAYVQRSGDAVGLEEIYRSGVFAAETRRDCAISLSRLVRAGRLLAVDVEGQRLYRIAGLPC